MTAIFAPPPARFLLCWILWAAATLPSEAACGDGFCAASETPANCAPDCCFDSTTWSQNRKRRHCQWVGKKPASRCTKKGNRNGDTRVAWEACPVACQMCAPSSCLDSASWTFTTKRGSTKNCDWVAKKARNRCKRIGEDDGVPTWAYDGCPETCGKCSDLFPQTGRTGNDVGEDTGEAPPTVDLEPSGPAGKYKGSSCNLQGPDPNDPSVSVKLQFYTLGDSPYDKEAGYPYVGPDYKCLRDEIFPRIAPSNPNFDGRHADFVAHVGDIIKGSPSRNVQYCNEKVFGNRQTLFDMLEEDGIDFYLVPGDNEWNECSNYDGGPNPVSRDSSEALWRSFFANEGSPFHEFDLSGKLPTSGVSPPVVARFEPNYPELFFFSYSNVAFIGINEPMNHNAMDDSSLFDKYHGDVNAYWIDSKLAGLSKPPSAIVVFGHSTFSGQVKEVLRKYGKAETPVLYVNGNTHPNSHCFKKRVYDGVSMLDLTVAPFRAGPLLVSIVVDSYGTHFFHVQETRGC